MRGVYEEFLFVKTNISDPKMRGILMNQFYFIFISLRQKRAWQNHSTIKISNRFFSKATHTHRSIRACVLSLVYKKINLRSNLLSLISIWLLFSLSKDLIIDFFNFRVCFRFAFVNLMVE
jgi:hypothetical protein